MSWSPYVETCSSYLNSCNSWIRTTLQEFGKAQAPSSDHSEEVSTLNGKRIKCINQEELQHDPLYAAIVIATIHLINQNYILEDTERDNYRSGIKIRMCANCEIQIDEPGYFQGLNRAWTGHKQAELCVLRKHIVKALKWFLTPEQTPKQQKAIRTIFRFYVLGLKVLKKSYEPEACDAKQLKLKLPKNAQLKLNAAEVDFTSRGIEQDIQFIEDVLKADESEAKRLILEEDTRLFQLHNIELQEGSSETIDSLFAKKVKELWPKETLIAVAKLFKIQPMKGLDPLSAIRSLTNGNPQKFMRIQREVHQNLTQMLLPLETRQDADLRQEEL